MFFEVSGIFTKIAFAEDVDRILLRGLPSRPKGRFNSPGQDALYLSANEQSSRTALIKYVRSDDRPRVIIEYEVERCRVVDLRHPEAIDWLTSSRGDWRKAVDEGITPKSWDVADSIRTAGHIGLIDPSRKKKKIWHLTLFSWNVPGAPEVKQRGEPNPISMYPA